MVAPQRHRGSSGPHVQCPVQTLWPRAEPLPALWGGASFSAAAIGSDQCHCYCYGLLSTRQLHLWDWVSERCVGHELLSSSGSHHHRQHWSGWWVYSIPIWFDVGSCFYFLLYSNFNSSSIKSFLLLSHYSYNCSCGCLAIVYGNEYKWNLSGMALYGQWPNTKAFLPLHYSTWCISALAQILTGFHINLMVFRSVNPTFILVSDNANKWRDHLGCVFMVHDPFVWICWFK